MSSRTLFSLFCGIFARKSEETMIAVFFVEMVRWTALGLIGSNQTGWNCGHKFAVPPSPPKKNSPVPPTPMKTTTCHVCHAGTLAAPFFMKDLSPRHLGHAVGMTHAGTLAAPVPMKFLNTCGTFAAPVQEVWNMLVTIMP